MNYRSKRIRTTLLLGIAFIAGAVIGPASNLIANQFARGLGINAAFAQDTDRANISRLPEKPKNPLPIGATRILPSA